ncbi:hypothetical protein I9W82_003664 [Candida metapsilosis]|uniref:E3 ubiquitin-protein ligase n=1 Tax=Candida metapsilosis TaxID=273372 RepID=A0A8H7ZFB5_9ASCO|nr:hypothetical protein I9W82_003664 [Candida metapsilosis]
MNDQLKPFLFLLPSQYNFHFSDQVRTEINKALLLSITDNGKYLDRVFPELLDPYEQLEKDFDWSLSKYIKLLATTKHGTEPQAHFASHPNRPCSRVFRRGEPIIRCLTCAFDQSCALCSHCYQPSEHEDHEIAIQICIRDNGGVCDCGDPEAWKASSTCVNGSRNFEGVDNSIPTEFQRAISRTLGSILDFIIDVTVNCDMQFTSPFHAVSATVQKNFELSTLDPHRYGICSDHCSDKTNGKFHLQMYNDQARHFRDVMQRVCLASGKSKDFANMVTQRAHSFGKAKVLESSNVDSMIFKQTIIGSLGLGTSIRSARDVFRESMVHELISWLSDFTETEFFRLSLTTEDLFAQAFCERWQPGLLNAPKDREHEHLRAGILGNDYKIPKVTSENHRTLWLETDLPHTEIACNLCGKSEIVQNGAVGSRLQYMMFLNLRLWKAARELSHIMYSTSLVTNLKYRHIMSSQYMEMYVGATDQFICLDREPEFNVMFSLSMQLFANQGNSEAIIKQGGFGMILSALFTFLTRERISAWDINNRPSHEISLKSLRNRRWGQLFLDIAFIITRGKDVYDVSDEDIAHGTCEIMSLFQGRPVIKREKSNHIEYETADYAIFFNSVSAIYKFGELSASTLSSRTYNDTQREEKALDAIEYIIRYLLSLELHEIEGINYECTDIGILAHRQALMEPMTRKLLKASNIDGGNVSFLHPLHSYMCTLIERSQFRDWNGLLERFAKVGSNVGLPESFFIESLIFDYPIKTLALMSQIKCGYWVRNGFTVKSQLRMYRNTGLREYGYMKDLCLVQIFSSMCDPDLVAYMILDRWLLQGDWNLSYDSQILPYILEECVTLFINLMTENLSLKGLSESDLAKLRIEKEIIHYLCFKPLSFKSLCSLVSEKSVLDKRFELILNRMTKFTKPVGKNDSGAFELKEVYRDQVDPYYFDYSTNTRDEALRFVKERVHKDTGKAGDDIVIEPNINVDDILDIYKYCGNVSSSVHFTKFLIKVLHFISGQEFDKVESLLETTLHLIHVCAMEKTIDTSTHVSFFTRFVSVDPDPNTSMSLLLGKFLLKEKYKTVHVKIRAILSKLNEKYSCLESIVNEQLEDCGFECITIDAKNESNSEDIALKKKKLAKMRQLRLLNKFRKQQSKFLEQNSATEYSDSEMDEVQSESSSYLQDNHCILCQNTSSDLGPFGIIANIGKSSTFRNVPFRSEYWFLKSFSDPANLNGDDGDGDNELHSEGWENFMSTAKGQAPFGPGFDAIDCVESKLTASSCGHGMHFKCYLNYLSDNRARQNQITRNTPENPDSKEILCPLCKAVNNVFIPMFGSNGKQHMDDVKCTQQQQRHNHNPIDDDYVSQLIESKELDIVPSEHESHKRLAWLKSNYEALCDTWNTILNSITPIAFPKSFESALPIILSTTIKSSEIALRRAESTKALVFKQIPSKSLAVMNALNEMHSLIQFQPVDATFTIAENALAKVFARLVSLTPTGMPETIMEADFMDLLVEATPLPSSKFAFLDVLRVTFIGHLVQCIYVLVQELNPNIINKERGYDINDVPVFTNVDASSSMNALRCFDILGGQAITSHGGSIGEVLYTMLVKAVTPFLRRASIYAYLQASIEQASSNTDRQSLEADELCAVMKIPTISQTLKNLCDLNIWEGDLLQRISTTYSSEFHKQLMPTPKLEYPGVLRLIDLPDRLDEFFSGYYYSEKFDKPYQSIEDPAICLICGAVVDLQKRAIGTVEGQCTTHYSRECSNEDGIFLLPKDRVMLLLHNYKGSFHNAPYLDNQGELADENKKGRALHLMPARYNDFIRSMWLEHNIANYIARNLESVLDPGGWETL